VVLIFSQLYLTLGMHAQEGGLQSLCLPFITRSQDS